MVFITLICRLECCPILISSFREVWLRLFSKKLPHSIFEFLIFFLKFFVMGMEFGIIIKKTVNPVLEVIDDVFKSIRGEEIKGFFNIYGLILADLKQLATLRKSTT